MYIYHIANDLPREVYQHETRLGVLVMHANADHAVRSRARGIHLGGGDGAVLVSRVNQSSPFLRGVDAVPTQVRDGQAVLVLGQAESASTSQYRTATSALLTIAGQSPSSTGHI